ncbi:MAG: 3-isopropylmalate dehydrogenase [Pseudomonadota bacterium]|jgi:3-isopropylmalate dehydrogenase|nr:3-isopropylmalate dehydrogenase [Pseudomonadota bacterium]
MSDHKKILLLPGDGIGPEVVAEARRVLEALQGGDFNIEFSEGLIGGCAVDADGTPLPDATLEKARAADAVLMGAVGGPKWDTLDRPLRPERGLLRIRAALDLYANLRPVLCFDELAEASTLKPEIVRGLDILIVRELTGGIYFGEPRGVVEEGGQRVGINTERYSESEIERICRSAFEYARVRDRRVCSVDKANVLESSQLWRDTAERVARDYPDCALSHMYVDNAAMQLVRGPGQFDVLVTSNLFGDILSDIGAQLTGSIGMLPSASLNRQGQGLYEPVHGSAPDIAGQGKANPLATILSAAMMLRYSLGRGDLADRVEAAVKRVLANGLRTGDIAGPGEAVLSTAQMGAAVVAALH